MIEISEHSDIDKVWCQFDAYATNAIKSHKKVYIDWGTDKGMTKAQRGSLHVWCDQVAKALNDAGLPMIRKALFTQKDIEIDWTMLLVKEHIYKVMLNTLTQKTSTEDQSTIDPGHVAETIARHFANNGVILPFWPSKDR